ncbi:galactoside ABC transporter, periplasmic d-galactose/d-glucose-binding protein [Plakobranchus ocellatus]|uniref:Galactoside ABC transporter, periplasmic d-galactose/d-glucose-binding protein n=1 Tax=Plakobranchus ocellatus TaxID=259542 RepID=A0AAV4AY90_9GAST|nr:galactoside ABC transporter, periplasmic d-galactose/d-glucose-binding protein [Plakobranchus ocellatus]
MGFGTQAVASTTVGFTIYKYDDNFMSVVRQAIEKEAGQDSDTRILMNDSQNSQSMQNDQVDVMLARGVQALAINLVDPAAAPTIIQKAKMDDVPIVFYNKEPSAKALASYDKAYYVGTDSKESGIIQGDLIAQQWKANPSWDKNGDGVLSYVLLKGEPGHPDAEAHSQAKATFELARNLANGKAATEGTQWELNNKVVRVPYVGVDKSTLE